MPSSSDLAKTGQGDEILMAANETRQLLWLVIYPNEVALWS
jgi:hypothetical protein